MRAFLILASTVISICAADKKQKEEAVLTPTSPRLINGDPATPGAYPYFTSSTLSSGYLCSSTLVAPDMLLSAGHCIFAYPISAIVNITVMTSIENGGMMRHVVDYYLHEDFNDWTIDNDIMLMKISPPIYSITPLELNLDKTLPADGASLTTIGFGRDETFELSRTLQQVTLVKDTDEVCNDLFEFEPELVMCTNKWSALVLSAAAALLVSHTVIFFCISIRCSKCRSDSKHLPW
jgi:secreted trypsin-like serine protease